MAGLGGLRGAAVERPERREAGGGAALPWLRMRGPACGGSPFSLVPADADGMIEQSFIYKTLKSLQCFGHSVISQSKDLKDSIILFRRLGEAEGATHDKRVFLSFFFF